MLGCKPIDTLMDSTTKLGAKKDNEMVGKGKYQRPVKKLMYLSHTRLNINFSVSVISQFMNNPTKKNMEVVHRILRYLKITPRNGLYFKKTLSNYIEIFIDVDQVRSISNCRSTFGYCTYVWRNLVTWCSKKQSIVLRSSAKSKFRVVTHMCEGLWLRRVLRELRILIEKLMKMFCDNQSGISIAKNLVHQDRTKHVEIGHHFIKEKKG